MESTEDNQASGQIPKVTHIRLKSKEFNISYEVFCSEKFMGGIRKFDNRSLKRAISRLRTADDLKSKIREMPKDWIFIKEKTKKLISVEMRKI